MANYSELLNDINAAIYENNDQEIDALEVRAILREMVASLGSGFLFKGIATPSSPSGTGTYEPDQNVFYLATTAGTYTYLGGLVVAAGEVAFLCFDGTWTKKSSALLSTGSIVDNTTTEDATKPLSAKQGKVLADAGAATAAEVTALGHEVSEMSLDEGKGIIPIQTRAGGFYFLQGVGNIVKWYTYASRWSMSTPEIAVSEGDTFLYYGSMHGIHNEAFSVAFLDSSHLEVSIQKDDNNIHFDDGYTARIVTIPSGVAFVKFQSCGTDTTPARLEVYKVGTKWDDFNKAYYDLYGITILSVAGGYMTTGGGWSASATITSQYTRQIWCKPGDKFHYKGRSDYSVAGWLIRKGNTILSYGQVNGEADVTIAATYIVGGVTYVADSIQFSSYNYPTSQLSVEKLGSAHDLLKQIDTATKGNVLSGKKWVACGDSFTHGDFTGMTPTDYQFQDEPYAGQNKVYPFFIGRRNNMTIVNEAVNGSTMAITKEHIDDPSVPITTRSPFSYQRYQQIAADADYITLWFGINDVSHAYLGTIDDVTNETFYGAWNVVLQYLITNHPTAKIGIVVTNFVTASSPFVQAIRDVALKWGVPYLDMVKDPQVPPIFNRDSSLGYSATAEALRTATFRVAVGNTHPNPVAHEYESTFIENWLRSL